MVKCCLLGFGTQQRISFFFFCKIIIDHCLLIILLPYIVTEQIHWSVQKKYLVSEMTTVFGNVYSHDITKTCYVLYHHQESVLHVAKYIRAIKEQWKKLFLRILKHREHYQKVRLFDLLLPSVDFKILDVVVDNRWHPQLGK